MPAPDHLDRGRPVPTNGRTYTPQRVTSREAAESTGQTSEGIGRVDQAAEWTKRAAAFSDTMPRDGPANAANLPQDGAAETRKQLSNW